VNADQAAYEEREDDGDGDDASYCIAVSVICVLARKLGFGMMMMDDSLSRYSSGLRAQGSWMDGSWIIKA